MNRRLGLLLEILYISVILIDGFLLLTSSLLPFKMANYQNIAYFDLITSMLLLVGYLVQMQKNEPKAYLKRNWNLVIIVIPFSFIAINILGIDGPFTVLKILNIIKVVALMFAVRQVGRSVDEFVEKSRLIYGVAFFLAVLLISSISFFIVENGINPNVTNYEDSLWYVIQTITTVGYGDVVPYTSLGRVVGVIAMLSAIGISSLLTAATTSSLMDKFRHESDKLSKRNSKYVQNLEKKIDTLNSEIPKKESMDNLHKELKDLKSEIQELKNLLEKK
ncbi:MAG: ion channel [Methanobacteriaceae archaeon]|nr:ion channel [Methanobacteriaceae archaeon]MDP3033540.1 ion channel [Methanobacteriaceae archaeon]MDP3484461.1 ion channel [Methanobacteriaceae archaeon]